jgi:Nuclease A inhibitor-like protein
MPTKPDLDQTPSQDSLAWLRRLIAGLQWQSESDFPLEVCEWYHEPTVELTPELLLDLTQHPPQTLVEIVDVDVFFETATTVQDWYGDSETAIAHRYQELLKQLKAHLKNLTVYCIGTVTIDVYVLGIDLQGAIVGISTQVIET